MHLLIGMPVAALVLWLWLRGSLFVAILLTLAVLLLLNGPDMHPAPGMLPLAILVACCPWLVRVFIVRRQSSPVMPWRFRAAVEVHPNSSRLEAG